MEQVNATSFRWTMDAAGDWLCIQTNKARQVLDGLKEGKSYDVEIKEHREKRSLDSNAYAWVLIDRLAEKLHIPKTGWEHNGLGWQTDTMPSTSSPAAQTLCCTTVPAPTIPLRCPGSLT